MGNAADTKQVNSQKAKTSFVKMTKVLLNVVVLPVLLVTMLAACGEEEVSTKRHLYSDSDSEFDWEQNQDENEDENREASTEEQSVENALCANGHFYLKACQEGGACRRCGAVNTNPEPHDFAEATCRDSAKCKVCGFEQGEPLGHFVEEDTLSCARCGRSAYKGPYLKGAGNYSDEYFDITVSGTYSNSKFICTVDVKPKKDMKLDWGYVNCFYGLQYLDNYGNAASDPYNKAYSEREKVALNQKGYATYTFTVSGHTYPGYGKGGGYSAFVTVNGMPCSLVP